MCKDMYTLYICIPPHMYKDMYTLYICIPPHMYKDMYTLYMCINVYIYLFINVYIRYEGTFTFRLKCRNVDAH